MTSIKSYKNWKTMLEQTEVSDKKQDQVDNLSDEMGTSEEGFMKAFFDKINYDTGEKRNIMGKVPEDIGKGMVEAIVYSDKTPKKFYKEPKSYKFKADHTNSAGDYTYNKDIIKDQDKWILASSENEDGIPYINVDGEFMMATQDQIVKDINSKNADLYADKKETDQYKLIRVKQSDKPNGYLYVYRAALVKSSLHYGNPGLYVVAPTKFDPVTTNKSIKTGETTVTPGKDAVVKKLKFNIKLDTNEGSNSGVTFATGKSAVQGDASGVIYSKLVEQAKKQGVEDISTLRITKFTVISSASNQWGGKVAATHDNAGNPTKVAYNAPVQDNPGWKVENAESNFNLAKQRGTNLGNVLSSGLKEKGISEIAAPTVAARVTDTGGKNDYASGGKEGRNKSTHPNPGQYAQLVIEAEATGEDEVVTPATPETSKSTHWFTQFVIYMYDENGGGNGLVKYSNFGLSKPKYLKKGGKGWKSPGYIKRHGGGNRPTSGLANWFDKLFYSGV